ncbi:MAG TPA: TIGR03084 family metal-binding protein [Acidimicrobiales bacterium]|nr:TIGR03084 family metal-binding protein [Acidimicrobiales bacterium]
MNDAPPTMAELCDDLSSEHALIRDLVIGLGKEELGTPTPSQGWSIGDQLNHLAYFDEKVLLSAIDPEEFARDVERAIADFEAYEASHLQIGRNKSPIELIGWWETSRSRLIDLFSAMDPKERLAWYGPSMSARSSATARFMETWAHGLDIFDALGVVKPANENVRHICDLGVRTREFSFAIRSTEPPPESIYVELISPSQDHWTWGAPDSSNTVKGLAYEFACTVTQRRNLADTGIVVTGPAANAWMQIAQAFAGPPGPGRPPSRSAVSPKNAVRRN